MDKNESVRDTKKASNRTCTILRKGILPPNFLSKSQTVLRLQLTFALDEISFAPDRTRLAAERANLAPSMAIASSHNIHQLSIDEV